VTSGAQNAAGLCRELADQGADPQLLASWTGLGYEAHFCGFPAGNFAVEPGQAYFLGVNEGIAFLP
jgi:hypothetical protein